jgi:hypothetical protein
MMSSLSKLVLGAFVGAAVLTGLPERAHAQSIIKQPGNHPDYTFEAEPHGLIGFDPPGRAHDNGLGVGFRGAFNLVDNGFISKINNSVAIGFGLDYIHYDDDDYGYWCGNKWRDRYDCGNPYYDDFDVDYFVLPVVLQWNFYLHRKWSVFGEAGGGLAFISADDWYGDDDIEFFPMMFFGGGRFHFSDAAALTMRIGYPYASVGVSFFL